MWFKQYELEMANRRNQDLEAKLQKQDYDHKLRLQQDKQKMEQLNDENQKARSEVENIRGVFTFRLQFFIFMWILSSTIALYYSVQVTESLLLILKFFRIEH